ncbi:hypothetical protein LB518_16735 [Mesorhizobium sp. BR1-1-16]|uniref:hypothetical protein n=1 Tax=Mesorhizobium sp. BR1-1-16 TaxID=2876653 RepID=UPI001CCA6ABE|nr:hypothetical protein [Mesorhizobium sp. BR1-1-16]MBZ9937949.1 hypothetical protein [Mesorhizobium sp. BR1-1-16]
MTDTTGRRRRSKSRSSTRSGGSRTARWHWSSPKAVLLAKGVVAAFVSLVAIVFISQHFSADDVVSPIADAGWHSDGVTGDLAKGVSALIVQPPALDEARAAANRALELSPLNIGALDILAYAADGAGDKAAVARYRNLIYERTRRHTPTLRWKFDDAVAARDFATATEAAKAMLRQDIKQPNSRYVMAVLVSLTSDKQARPFILTAVSEQSPWRRTFLDLFASQGDPELFPDFMASLPPVDGMPFNTSWNAYFDRLIKGGASRQAYVIWTSLQPADQMRSLALLYNGGFELPASGLPFDWTIAKARGMEIVADPDDPGEGSSSLRVTFGGSPMDFRHVRQTLILDPGRYKLSGMTKTQDLVTSRGLSWGIYCNGARGETQLDSSPSFSGTSGWTRFSVEFDVPPQFCDYQTIRLELPARIDAERRVQGTLWVDDLSIVSVQPPDAGTTPAAGG